MKFSLVGFNRESLLKQIMNPTSKRRKRRNMGSISVLISLYLAVCFCSQALAVSNHYFIAQSLSSNATLNGQHKREVMRGGDGELLDMPYPAQKFQMFWSSREQLPLLLGRRVVSPPFSSKTPRSSVEEAPIVAQVTGIIENNPLLKSLSMFQLEQGDSYVNITSPNQLKTLNSTQKSGVTPTKKPPIKPSFLPLKRSMLKKSSFGVEKTVRGTRLGSDAAVAQAYATLADIRTQHGVVDNFDEIYQKQPYPPLPLTRNSGVTQPSTLITSTSSITDYISSVVTNSNTTPQFTTKVMADQVVSSSTPFDHTNFDEEARKWTVTTSSFIPNRSTTARTIRKQSSTKKTLHSFRSTTSGSGPWVANREPINTSTHYAPTTAAGKFQRVEEGIAPQTLHWDIEMDNHTEEHPFEVTDFLESALSTASPTSTSAILVRNEPTKEWRLQSSSSQPTTRPPLTTSLSSRSSLVMMQQEEYPKKELSFSRRQLYPWERQREILVPFSTTKSKPLSTLQPFPPIMPGASFYVDQHVSHGHFGREPASKGQADVVYDPNILESRYGFSGMLPQSAVASVKTPLTALKKKPTTFGVQNLPIAGEVTFTLNDKQLADASNAVFFFIPITKKLSRAKAIKVRAQANFTLSNNNLSLPQLSSPTYGATKLPQQLPTLIDRLEDLSPPITHFNPLTPLFDKRRTMSMERNHLNWRPLVSGPKKLKPVKFVPLSALLEGNSLVEDSANGKEQPQSTKLEVELYDDFNPVTFGNCSNSRVTLYSQVKATKHDSGFPSRESSKVT